MKIKLIKNWLITGDCHGNIFKFKTIDKKIYKPNETAIICLGDMGINYYLNGNDKKIKEKLKRIGFTYYIVRGNHEERPSNIETMNKIYDENVNGYIYMEEQFPNIHYFMDGGDMYVINNKKCLIVPGAYSIDKYYRLENGYKWFKDEQLNEVEKEELKQKITEEYDYILSHTCPISFQFYIKDLFLGCVDNSTIDNSTEFFLQEIYDNYEHKPYVYFGHYHDDRNVASIATMLYNKIIPFENKINYGGII